MTTELPMSLYAGMIYSANYSHICSAFVRAHDGQSAKRGMLLYHDCYSHPESMEDLSNLTIIAYLIKRNLTSKEWSDIVAANPDQCFDHAS